MWHPSRYDREAFESALVLVTAATFIGFLLGVDSTGLQIALVADCAFAVWSYLPRRQRRHHDGRRRYRRRSQPRRESANEPQCDAAGRSPGGHVTPDACSASRVKDTVRPKNECDAGRVA